ncbi:MAG: RHH-type transcriptional regulator, proline utilization regulon repressor / proline dehydrogenase, partial [Solirubrobacteraceae bacterium]|nr:RHH-type transcriptional regulator, proline utilization regulon repressor / proline dehydrogenase [Solirubrobacteraceae bacterium]
MAGLAPFANEPILELRRGAVRAGLADALSALDRTLPLRVPVIVADSERGGEELLSTDPGAPQRLVASAACAGE